MSEIIKNLPGFLVENLTQFWWPAPIIIIILMIISVLIQKKIYENRKKRFYKGNVDDKLILYFEKEKKRWSRYPSPQVINKYNTICFMLSCAYLDRNDLMKFYDSINAVKPQYKDGLQKNMDILFVSFFSGAKSVSVINMYNEYESSEDDPHIFFEKMTHAFPFIDFQERCTVLKQELSAKIQEYYLCDFIRKVEDVSKS